MPKTVFITGCSTGIGRATALYFHEKGWNVSASMRRPEKETALVKLPGVICPRLDVTDLVTIRSAVRETIKNFGTIDVLVNNAGYGLLGPFEGASAKQTEKQFDTNVLGLIRVTREILPVMRSAGSGTVVNLSSNAGRIGFPYYSLYNATKFAVEGLSEALAHELAPYGIRIRVIEPGPVETDFFTRSAVYAKGVRATYCAADSERVLSRMSRGNRAFKIRAETVAALIFRAANDGSGRLRYPAGAAARLMLFARNILPDRMLLPMIRTILSGKE